MGDPLPEASVRSALRGTPEILGGYRLIKLLGRGGMGEVWQAYDDKLQRDVAVKTMRPELAVNSNQVDRFLHEARAVAKLHHQNIMEVYAFGEDQGIYFIVTIHLEGETLAQRLERAGPLSVEEASSIVRQTTDALDYAYTRGIVHRDIKPGNLMITPGFNIKVMDFGLAKVLEHDSGMSSSQMIGSPAYMSPEQIQGGLVDHRADIYGLGITFFEMLVGSPPFRALRPVQVLMKHMQEPLPVPDKLKSLAGGRVLPILQKMTAKSPDDRYQTYGGLNAAIAALATPSARVSITPSGKKTGPGKLQPFIEICRQYPIVLPVLILAVGAIIASVWLMTPLFRGETAKSRAPGATKPTGNSPAVAATTPLAESNSASAPATSSPAIPATASGSPNARAITSVLAGTLPVPTQFHGTAIVQNRLFVFGGNTKDGWTNVVRSGTIDNTGKITEWRDEVAMPENRAYISNSVEVVGNQVYIIGGIAPPEATTLENTALNAGTVLWTRFYNGATLAPWQKTDALPCGGIKSTATCVSGNRIYMVGGQAEVATTADGLTDAIYASDIQSDGWPGVWQQVGTLPFPLWFHGASIYGNTLYVWGGLTERRDNTKVNVKVISAEIKPDRTIGTWQDNLGMPQGIYRAAFGDLGSHGLLTVSGSYSGGFTTDAIWWAKMRDRQLIQWVPFKTDIKTNLYHSVVFNADRGHIYIVGGKYRPTNDKASGVIVDAVQMLDIRQFLE